MTDAVTTLAAIERSLELSASPERVWRAITDPTELVKWFPNRAEWDLRDGGRGTFYWEGYGNFPIHVMRVDEPSYLAWRWSAEPDVVPDESVEPTLVEWWLTRRADGGTTLRMRESGFTSEKHRAGNDEGWTQELGELAELLS